MKSVILAVGLSLIVSSCFSKDSGGPPKELTQLKNKIDVLNKDISCEKNDDCIALPVGYRACGGPNGYIVSSKKNPNFADLKATIDKLYTVEKNWSEKEGMASICSVEIAPEVSCSNKKCGKLVNN